MADQLPRPGVEVLQKIQTVSPTVLRPTLPACIVGVAKEVIEVTTADGLVNSSAKQGDYLQLPKVISQTAFPSPRGNIAEVDVQEETVKAFLLVGATLRELRNSSFLWGVPEAEVVRPALVTKKIDTVNLDGLPLILSFDTVSNNTSLDVKVTFSGTALSPAEIVAQINGAVGRTCAEVVSDSPHDRVRISSALWGARASVTVRKGAQANPILGFSADQEHRVEGAGFRGQDQSDGRVVTSWVEWYPGAYLANGASASFPDGANPGFQAGFITAAGGFTQLLIASGRTFTGTGSLDLKKGDEVFGDGLRPGSGAVIMKVEPSRFRLGTVDPRLSTFDADGNVTNAVYAPALVGTTLSATPFAPKYTWFRANGLKKTASPEAAVLTGTEDAAAAEAASVQSASAYTNPTALALAGLTLSFSVTKDGVEQEPQTFVFSGGPFASNQDIVDAFNAGAIEDVVATSVTASLTTSKIKFSTVKTGANQALTLNATSTALSQLGFAAATSYSDTGKDPEVTGLAGKTLRFKLNGRPKVYSVTFPVNSLDEAVAGINEAAGTTVASKSSDVYLTLTSPLKGYASSVTVLRDTAADQAAATAFGFGSGSVDEVAVGDGRPLPDFYLDDFGNANVGAELLRNQISGTPVEPGKAGLYLQYTGVRKDLTALAKKPGLTRFTDITTLSTVVGPINTKNPLGLGLFFAMANAPAIEVTGLGVDEISGSEPYGTPLAFGRALSFLEKEEVYTIAPLTHSPTVAGLVKNHATVMSSGEKKGERIAFVNLPEPKRATDTLLASGLDGRTNGTANQFVADESPIAAIADAGLDADDLTVANNVTLEVSVGTALRRYSVSAVSPDGHLLTLRTSFASTENTDGFFETTSLDEVLVNADYKIYVRGEPLTLTGSSLPNLPKIAETVAGVAGTYKSRRLVYTFPDTLGASVGGVDQKIPGFYGCAAIAGMISSLPPQQGHTNYPMAGFTAVYGSNDKFSSEHLDTMAAGGTYILVQDTPGAPLLCRHQLTTDMTSIETRELSITKCLDFSAKFLRRGFRNFIGVFNITQAFLDTLTTVGQGMVAFLVNSGVLEKGSLSSLAQSTSQPDSVMVEIVAKPPYPCNYIKITLLV